MSHEYTQIMFTHLCTFLFLRNAKSKLEVFRIIIVGSSCTSDYKTPISHYPKWLVMDLVPKHWLVRNRESKSEIQQDNLH